MQQNQYFIHLDPTRIQQVQHYYSSLDTPTLENVQSQLEAQRIRNNQMGAAYFQQKYGNVARYDNIIKRTGYEPPEEQPLTVYEPNLYSVSGNKEYQEFLKNVLKQKQKQIEEAAKNEASKPKVKQNPWIQTKKPQIKPQEVKYVNQFQKFRQKKQQKQQVPVPKNNNKKRNYKRELVIKVFRELDTACIGYIQKPKLIEYLKNNIKIIQVCDLQQSQIATDVYSYETEDPEKMKMNQVLQFFGQNGNIQNLRQSIHYSKVNTKTTLITPHEFRIFEEIFRSLDPHNDLIIKRRAYTQALIVNPQVSQIFLKPAIKESKINREISFYRVLERIDLEEEFAEDQEKKIKQYLYFNQFLKYFQSEHRWDEESRSLNKLSIYKIISYLNKKHPQNQIHLDKPVINILQNALKKTNKQGPYFLTGEFKRNVTNSKQYKELIYTQIRAQNTENGTQTQTLENVLTRIQNTYSGYISIVQLLQFFGTKGTPYDLKIKKKNTQVTVQDQIKFPLNQNQKKVEFASQEKIDGYDSDPEIYQSGVYKSEKKLDDNFRGTFISVVEDSDAFSKLKSKTHSKSQGRIIHEQQYEPQPLQVFKITVPEPFSFQNRQLLNRKKKFKEEDPKQNTDQFQKNHIFKAKSIPKQVLQIGRFDKINQENQKRRQNIKKMNMLASLAVEKPFGFLTRQAKPRKKNYEQRKQFVFKSKPVPWFCKAEVYKQKVQEQQRLRKQRVQKMAQQNLLKSKLPPRMQRHQQAQLKAKAEQNEKQSKNKREETNFKAKAPPDFKQIHKQFDQKLQRNKQSKRTTVSQPFTLTETKIRPSLKQEQISQKVKIDPVEYAKKLNATEPRIKAASTLKYENQVQKRRKQIEQKKLKQEQKNRVEKSLFEEDLKIKLLRKKELQQAEKKTNTRVQSLKKQQQQKQKRFKQERQEIIQRVKAQPMLYQRPLKRDQQLQKAKKLYAMSQIIQGNAKGLKQKDRREVYNNMFTKEEQNLISNYKYLMKSGHVKPEE